MPAKTTNEMVVFFMMILLNWLLRDDANTSTPTSQNHASVVESTGLGQQTYPTRQLCKATVAVSYNRDHRLNR
jgi:hypothetical protein